MCTCCNRRNVDSSGLQLQKKKSVTRNICLPGSKEPGLFLLHGYRLWCGKEKGTVCQAGVMCGFLVPVIRIPCWFV